MSEGHRVVCIRGDFPLIPKYGGIGKEANNSPKVGELLIVDEVLGDFLRFDKYDTDESHNWWIRSHFAPINETEMNNAISKLMEESKIF